MVRQRGRGRGGPNQNFQRAPGQQSQHQAQQHAAAGNAQGQKKTLKFEGDYDFEEANTQFEELRSKLAKAKLGALQKELLQLSCSALRSLKLISPFYFRC